MVTLTIKNKNTLKDILAKRKKHHNRSRDHGVLAEFGGNVSSITKVKRMQMVDVG
jgi:hypothetical protein